MKLPAGLSESDVVKRVTVRLVMDQERAEFDRLLEEKHYVHESRLTGETLRYILELDGQWVALAAFSAASLHLKARERWIGWSPRQRARRLCMVVNNSRFLVLPERECYPNLASRGLGLCLRRLSQDWSAIENGTHYRRDVTLGEDANRTHHRQGAEALTTMRNLVNGIYELEIARNRTKVGTLNSWCQQQTFSTAWTLLNR